MNEHRKHTDNRIAVDCAFQLRTAQRELMRCVGRVERNTTPASVHDLRTAIRRSLVLLSALGDVLNPIATANVRFDLKSLIHITGAARDAHVRRKSAASILESIKTIQPQELEICLSMLKDASRSATIALRLKAREANWASCLKRIRETLNSPQLFGLDDRIEPQRLASWFAKRLRRIDHALAHKPTTPNKLHRLRIKVRNSRYGGELLNSVIGKGRSEVVSLLKRLQNSLGDLHDVTLLTEWLSDSAVPEGARTKMRRKLAALKATHYRRYLADRKPLRRAIKQYRSSI